MKNEDTDLLDNLCEKGIHLFDPAGIRIFLNALTWITSYRPALSAKVLENLCQLWERSAVGRLGIYSKPSMYVALVSRVANHVFIFGRSLHAFFNRISYGSPEKQKKESNEANVHLQIVRFLLFRFQTDCFLGKSKIQPYVNLILSINRFSYLFRYISQILRR